MTTVAVLTTHNEAFSIRGLVTDLRSWCDHVVVVDENSTDGTFSVAYGTGALVRQDRGGIGPCLRTGWRLALTYNPDRVVTIDAGGSHDPRELPRLLVHGADIVIGSRFVHDGLHTGPLWRRQGSRWFGRAWAAKMRTPILDWTSGYRSYSARAIRTLAPLRYNATMHGWQAEVLAHALMHGLSVKEVPITYAAGESSLDRDVAREAWHAWREFSPQRRSAASIPGSRGLTGSTSRGST